MSYPQLCEDFFARLEEHLDEHDTELDYESNGSICDITLANGTQLIVNRQPPVEEIWLAAKSGGFHFRHQAGNWCDTRNGTEFFVCLDNCIADQR